MFLLARKIKAMGVKMVMSGEGADETLGGYLYFHKVPPPSLRTRVLFARTALFGRCPQRQLGPISSGVSPLVTSSRTDHPRARF